MKTDSNPPSARTLRVASGKNFSSRRKHVTASGLLVSALWFCLLSPVLAAPGSWTQKADIPLPSSTPAACVVDGILYVIGGHYPFTTALRQVFAYDPRTDSWTRKTDMPTARRFLAGAAVDGIIYVIGGSSGPFDTRVPLKTVEAYDPKTGTWVTKADMPTARELLAACTVDGIIYAIGGGADFYHPYATVEAYDPDRDRFTSRRKMPRTRMTAACGAIDGKIVLAGGVSKDPAAYPDSVYYRAVDVFDPQGGVPPQILSATLETTNRLRLVWQAEAGIKYGVESSPEVVTNRWTPVTLPTGSTVTATNELVETSCLVTPGEPRRFYRVLEAN